jgi:hypothetical protein
VASKGSAGSSANVGPRVHRDYEGWSVPQALRESAATQAQRVVTALKALAASKELPGSPALPVLVVSPAARALLERRARQGQPVSRANAEPPAPLAPPDSR